MDISPLMRRQHANGDLIYKLPNESINKALIYFINQSGIKANINTTRSEGHWLTVNLVSRRNGRWRLSKFDSFPEMMILLNQIRLEILRFLCSLVDMWNSIDLYLAGEIFICTDMQESKTIDFFVSVLWIAWTKTVETPKQFIILSIY